MKKLVIITLLYLLTFYTLSAQIKVDAIDSSFKLIGNPEVQALKSVSDVSINNIIKSTSWKAYDSTFTASRDTAVWMSFKLKNTTQEILSTYLFYDGHYIDIYLEKEDEYKHYKNGYFRPLNQRPEPKSYFFTELKLSPLQQSQCYIKLSTNYKSTRFTAPILYSKIGHLEFTNNLQKIHGPPIAFIYVYLISMCCIAFFVLVFYFRLQKRIYIYYFGYLFFQIIYALLVLQTTPATIANFAVHFPYFSNLISESAQFIFIGFYILFILHLLTVKMFDRKLAKTLTIFAIICFTYAILWFGFNLVWVDMDVRRIASIIIRVIVLPLNLFLFFWIIYKVKHPLLKYFVVGQSLFFIGSALSSIVYYSGLYQVPNGIFSFPYSQNVIFMGGLLGEVLCFSIALGESMFLVQKDKEKTSQKLIEQLQRNKIMESNMRKELDKQINQKTKELVQVYSKIEKQKEEQLNKSFNERLRNMKMLALRSQMNPHFIFNSLNALKNLVMQSREEDAISYLDNFSLLLRNILQNSSKNSITVEDELEILELYLSLEKRRLGNNFSYVIQCDSREILSQYNIPPLLLQPFVENAIWHGLYPSNKPEKKLTLVFDTSKQLQIIIEDNGIGRKESSKTKKTHQSAGTNITKERLTLYNHVSHTQMQLSILDLEDNGKPSGTRITITYND
ncbi:sensor histidine kinase YesM [Gelidibacter sediminis]|uniref:Sensor histidine kinase YesM n=1 Tax=Gelidibacter sediminis TaxID=1608710 RepID=A0A4R7Q294_9FLAO|nr:histidine kinase [Gelidibacter sediminis]TDU40600.1 sensor histidine kinase YesM [Gelidibacter sediminis]